MSLPEDRALSARWLKGSSGPYCGRYAVILAVVLTAHTIIATPAVWLPFEEQGQSVAGWLTEAVEGNLKDYINVARPSHNES